MFGYQPTTQELWQNLQKVISAHNQLAGQIATKMNEAEQQQIRNFVKEMLIRNYDGGKSYTRVVIAVGYASFFALWSALKGDLPRMTMLASGLLATVSVVFFMTSEVYNMVSSGIHFRRVSEILSEGASSEIIESIKELEYRFSTDSYRVWLSLLIPTLLTAALSALFLLSSFILGIYNELMVELHI